MIVARGYIDSVRLRKNCNSHFSTRKMYTLAECNHRLCGNNLFMNIVSYKPKEHCGTWLSSPSLANNIGCWYVITCTSQFINYHFVLLLMWILSTVTNVFFSVVYGLHAQTDVRSKKEKNIENHINLIYLLNQFNINTSTQRYNTENSTKKTKSIIKSRRCCIPTKFCSR